MTLRRIITNMNFKSRHRLLNSMKTNSIFLLLLMLLFVCQGCVSKPGIEKSKLSELNQAVKDLKTFITSGKPCDAPETVLQKLASGATAIKDKATSQDERDLVAGYVRLLTTYKDGLLLCRRQTQSAQLPIVPQGSIYVFQDVDPLVEKYGFSTESHLYKPTGVYWKSISGDSINVIWKNVEFQIKYIENIVNYY
jgi:hypothetical protein